ncbi:MAG: efflux RND transporter periplasmic adaptor subunit [Deltaproteobacteria bacterium]|nr:efflux RND transporter periplasmic adaptor subunit [Deltaproteobacteria bacterium]
MKRWAAWVRVAILACASSLAAGCSEKPTAAPAADAGPRGPRIVQLDPAAVDRLAVKVEPAGSQDSAHQIQVPGSLDFNVEKVARIGTVLEGRVTSVTGKVGDRVNKGQKMVTLVAPAVAAAQADYLSARAEATFTADRVNREQALAARDLTTAQELGLARSEKDKADAHVAAAEARLRALRVGIPSNEDRVAAAGVLALTSPIDGVIVEREVVLGQYLQPQDTAFVVADLSEVWAMLELFETDMPYLRIGSEVSLTLDAQPGKTYQGKLSSIEPHLGKHSRSVRARVVVPNASGELRPGFFVRASIQVLQLPGLLLVPSSAVQPLDDDDVVFVERSKGHYEVRQVNVARRTAEVSEISEGLARGERIVVQGAFLLRGEVSRQ